MGDEDCTALQEADETSPALPPYEETLLQPQYEDQQYEEDEVLKEAPPWNNLGSVEYLAGRLLDVKHLKVIHRTLSTHWDKRQMVKATARLMKDFHIEVSAEEQESLSQMEDEAAQVNALVAKVPEGKEEFQQFFLQLQRLVLAMTHVREGLAFGSVDAVEETLDEALAAGMGAHVLRMAAVQAGAEVAAASESYRGWVKEAATRTGKLVRGQDDAMAAQKKLAQAMAALDKHRKQHREKARNLMTGLAKNMDRKLLSAVLFGWVTATRVEHIVADVTKVYGKQLDSLTQKLGSAKAVYKSSASGLLQRAHKQEQAELLSQSFEHLREGPVDARLAKLADSRLEAKTKQIHALRASYRTGVGILAESNAELGSSTVFRYCWQAWWMLWDAGRQAREAEDKIASFDGQVRGIGAKQGTGAHYAIERVARLFDGGLVKSVFSEWKTATLDGRAERVKQKALAGLAGEVKVFSSRVKKPALAALEATAVMQDDSLLVQVLWAWRMEAKAEATMRLHRAKIDAKRQQLVGVQQMFRTFAQQLEAGLRNTGCDSNRDPLSPYAKGKKPDPTPVSLPEINPREVRRAGSRTRVQ